MAGGNAHGADLARQAGVSAAAVSQLLSGLQAAGLIERGARGGDDRRRQSLSLTPAGAAALASARALLRERLAGLLGDLPPPEVDALGRSLPRLEAILGGTAPPPRPGRRPLPPPPPPGGRGRGTEGCARRARRGTMRRSMARPPVTTSPPAASTSCPALGRLREDGPPGPGDPGLRRPDHGPAAGLHDALPRRDRDRPGGALHRDERLRRGRHRRSARGERPLDPEHLARIGPSVARRLRSGPDGMRVLCVGGVPGGVYEIPEWTDGRD